MYKYKRNFSIIAALSLAAGFLLPFWPLCLLGTLLFAGSGQYILAIVVGLLLDALYGAPVGNLHVLYVPFTLLSFVASAAHYYLSVYFRQDSTGTI